MIAAAKIEHARATRIEDEIARRGIKLKRVGAERIGPCPICGGRDRFSIHTTKQLWHCRNCGVGGNDAISLVRHLDGCGFVGAIDTLAGDGVTNQTPPPKREERDVYEDDQRKASKAAAWLWSQHKPITEGTPPWLYLRKRAYRGPIPATLGYLPPRGPYPAAMIAAFGMAAECDEPGIIGVPKSVNGVHLTHLTVEGDKAPNADGKAKIMRGVQGRSNHDLAPKRSSPHGGDGRYRRRPICLSRNRPRCVGRRLGRVHAGARAAHSSLPRHDDSLGWRGPAAHGARCRRASATSASPASPCHAAVCGGGFISVRRETSYPRESRNTDRTRHNRRPSRRRAGAARLRKRRDFLGACRAAS